MKNFSFRLTALFASNTFFWGIIIFFVLETLWFIFSLSYPLAFDEDFHLGVIKVYAETWSPFLGEQPPGADAFGALARDPSYLFHYLMSFPYRLLTLLTDNQVIHVIVLRVINLAMFFGGLLLFRRVLARVGTSAALTNIIFAIFILVPIVPYLAATINYDNLLFLMLPWLCLLAFRLNESLQEKKIDTKTLLIFIVGCMALSLVKYAVLPILLGLIIFLAVTAGRAFRGQYRYFTSSVVIDFNSLSIQLKTVLLVGFVIVFGMFFERYGVNTVLYQDPAPGCDAIISVEQCLQYGPYARNAMLAQTKGDFDTSPLTYMQHWLRGMWERTFFAVSGPANDYTTRLGLPVPSYAVAILAIAGALATVLFFRRTFSHQPLLQMILFGSTIYLVILWLTLYGSYVRTGQPVAINGRYLVPLLPLFGAIMGRSLSLAFEKFSSLKPYVALVLIAAFLYGGGVFTYIIRSEQPWLWQNETVREINNTARSVLSSFIIH